MGEQVIPPSHLRSSNIGIFANWDMHQHQFLDVLRDGERLVCGQTIMRVRAIYQNSVFQFIEHVPLKEGTEVDVYPRCQEKGNGKKPKSVRPLGVYGMWKDRDDIGTGMEYVRSIRKYITRRLLR